MVPFQELEDYLKKNGCKSVFVQATEATKNQTELDIKSIQFLSEKLVHFMDFRDSLDSKVDPQRIADSLIRLMPCIEKVTHSL